MSRLTPELVHQAVINASRKHMCKNEVIEFLQDKENEHSVYRQLLKEKTLMWNTGIRRLYLLTERNGSLLSAPF